MNVPQMIDTSKDVIITTRSELLSWRQSIFQAGCKRGNLRLAEPDPGDISFPTAAAIQAVVDERHRQVAQEGFMPVNDDDYTDGELATAAGCYLIPRAKGVHWPFMGFWWKPSTYRRNLVKAAALIIAEIERLDRAEKKTS